MPRPVLCAVVCASVEAHLHWLTPGSIANISQHCLVPSRSCYNPAIRPIQREKETSTIDGSSITPRKFAHEISRSENFRPAALPLIGSVDGVVCHLRDATPNFSHHKASSSVGRKTRDHAKDDGRTPAAINPPAGFAVRCPHKRKRALCRHRVRPGVPSPPRLLNDITNLPTVVWQTAVKGVPTKPCAPVYPKVLIQISPSCNPVSPP
jgi:hypothetical protein